MRVQGARDRQQRRLLQPLNAERHLGNNHIKGAAMNKHDRQWHICVQLGISKAGACDGSYMFK